MDVCSKQRYDFIETLINTAIKPCPMCNNKIIYMSKIAHYVDDVFSDESCYAVCSCCNYWAYEKGERTTEEQAIEDWNNLDRK